ncbi:hypothetical protein [Nocardia carnea]|uniref:hypothetical protein n=1 Tax=Nocardia carnea TaxID=37328 RepID=UPI0024576336|nr:hypothetical protein [Nocardia carnea]
MDPAITYLVGDATAPAGTGPKILAHIVNDAGAWGRGFVLAISRRWPNPEHSYRQWHAHRATNDFALGAVQLVAVTDEIHVANMVGQHGIRRRGSSNVPIRYDALAQCLSRLASHAAALNASVHMPRIGTGLAGGTWSAIEPLITEHLCSNSIPVTVYDRP